MEKIDSPPDPIAVAASTEVSQPTASTPPQRSTSHSSSTENDAIQPINEKTAVDIPTDPHSQQEQKDPEDGRTEKQKKKDQKKKDKEMKKQIKQKKNKKEGRPWYKRHPLKMRIPPPIPEERVISKEKTSSYFSQMTFTWITNFMSVRICLISVLEYFFFLCVYVWLR